MFVFYLQRNHCCSCFSVVFVAAAADSRHSHGVKTPHQVRCCTTLLLYRPAGGGTGPPIPSYGNFTMTCKYKTGPRDCNAQRSSAPPINPRNSKRTKERERGDSRLSGLSQRDAWLERERARESVPDLVSAPQKKNTTYHRRPIRRWVIRINFPAARGRQASPPDLPIHLTFRTLRDV